MVDLRKRAGYGADRDRPEHSRTVVVNSGNEEIGLLVDRVADVVCTRSDQIDPPPANVNGVDGVFSKAFTNLKKRC